MTLHISSQAIWIYISLRPSFEEDSPILKLPEMVPWNFNLRGPCCDARVPTGSKQARHTCAHLQGLIPGTSNNGTPLQASFPYKKPILQGIFFAKNDSAANRSHLLIWEMVGQAPTISLSMCSSEWVSTCFFSSFREANKNTLPVKTYAYTYVYIYIYTSRTRSNITSHTRRNQRPPNSKISYI